MTDSIKPDQSNVVDIFSRQPLDKLKDNTIIRLSAELDGLEMLYSNTANPGKLFSIRILCWALRNNGDVVGMVPWMKDIVPCPDINDPLDGQWEGYYDPGIDEVFYEAPIHKVIELETSAEYYQFHCTDPEEVIQEIPDNIGTHAVLNSGQPKQLLLKEVISWQLHCDGSLHAMLADPEKCTHTPVLPGDESLYSVRNDPDFRYFFQHSIANKLKDNDPEAMAVIASLVNGEKPA